MSSISDHAVASSRGLGGVAMSIDNNSNNDSSSLDRSIVDKCSSKFAGAVHAFGSSANVLLPTADNEGGAVAVDTDGVQPCEGEVEKDGGGKEVVASEEGKEEEEPTVDERGRVGPLGRGESCHGGAGGCVVGSDGGGRHLQRRKTANDEAYRGICASSASVPSCSLELSTNSLQFTITRDGEGGSLQCTITLSHTGRTPRNLAFKVCIFDLSFSALLEMNGLLTSNLLYTGENQTATEVHMPPPPWNYCPRLINNDIRQTQ